MVMTSSARNRFRAGCFGLGLAVVLAVTAGCTSATPATAAGGSAGIHATQPIPAAPPNDLKDNSAHHDVAVDGETFRLKVDYFTTVDAAGWTVLGPKNVHLLAYLNPAQGPKLPDVVIDYFEARVALVAVSPDLDGLVIDQMQDVAGSQIPGFLITPQISYGTVVATGGVGAPLLTRWQSLGGDVPVSEAALVQAGVYAIRMSFTYRLLVRNTGDLAWHRRTVIDQLTVPVKSARSTPRTTS